MHTHFSEVLSYFVNPHTANKKSSQGWTADIPSKTMLSSYTTQSSINTVNTWPSKGCLVYMYTEAHFPTEKP